MCNIRRLPTMINPCSSAVVCCFRPIRSCSRSPMSSLIAEDELIRMQCTRNLSKINQHVLTVVV
jgi:hypothetical protein